MDLMQEAKGYSDSREEEEEEEAGAEILTREGSSSKHQHYPFSSLTTNFNSHHPHHIIHTPNHQQNPWLGKILDRHHYQSPKASTTTESESHNSSSGLGLHHHHQQQQEDAASTFTTNHRKQLDLMELSLGNSNQDGDESNFQKSGGSSSTSNNNEPTTITEKEHMFNKVVTPSDVGKLNRLVIPKQHAEKYFPLDSNSNEKGLLLNFEDRNGKLWRFRYSYWNSSQSYVMTKGWSRFVKDKKLHAGDVVSFQRGLGESNRHRLYIDWRRRPDHNPSTAFITPLFLPNQTQFSNYSSIRWGSSRLYSLPSPAEDAPPRHHHDQFQLANYNNMYPFHHQLQQQHQEQRQHNLGSGSVYYLRSTPTMPMGDQRQQLGGGNDIIAPMIIDSVPVSLHHHQQQRRGDNSGSSTAAKRLRLFGVNMECASSSASASTFPTNSVAHVSTIAKSFPSLRVPTEEELHSSSSTTRLTGDISERKSFNFF